MQSINGKIKSGLGLAGKLGFPTINVDIKSTDCGAYLVKDVDHGEGIALVMPNLTEIHFFNEPEKQKDSVHCKVVEKIEPPENGILDYFYKGIQAHFSRGL